MLDKNELFKFMIRESIEAQVQLKEAKDKMDEYCGKDETLFKYFKSCYIQYVEKVLATNQFINDIRKELGE